MSNDAIKLKPAGTTYGVIHRLGLKYAPPAVARPTFEPQATLAKEFWQDMFIVFDNFRQTAIDESSARLAILTLVDEYGPRIWGADRVNVVSYPCQHCPEYSKDLYWDEGEETRQFIRDQAIALFEERHKKRDLSARKPGNSMGSLPKRIHQSYTLSPHDHVSFPATDASEIDEMSEYSELTELSDLSDSERVPYTLNVPQNGYHNGTTSQRRKRKKRSPYSLIVRLRYHGCDRTNRNEIPRATQLKIMFQVAQGRCCLNSHLAQMRVLNTSSQLVLRILLIERISLTPGMPRFPYSLVPCAGTIMSSKVKPICWACSHLGRDCVYPVEATTQGGLGQLPQQHPDWDRRSPPKEVQTSRLESEQYQKEMPAPSFTAVNHSKHSVVLPPDQRPAMPSESPLQISSQPPASNAPEYSLKSAVEQVPEIAVLTPSISPPLNTTLQQMPELVQPTVPAVTNVLRPEKDLVMVNEVQKYPNNHQFKLAEHNGSWKTASNEHWAIARLSKTIIHIRAGDGWDNMNTMHLGSYGHVNDFFARASRQLGSLVVHLSILLPGNVAKLDKYVIQIEQGDQEAYEFMLGILLEGIGRLGVGRPTRYVLAGTATCQ
ncbi:hypothetical protein EG327_002432 [Venturia inaequalis]|uniref:Uncharacterized protein n=1 Tax=Venturia inaequalis TaxID=5025 RepID=A0A8H3VKS9_VENIN|nr:hypothetical protein EG327_002432 [Venturia inaequalis]